MLFLALACSDYQLTENEQSDAGLNADAPAPAIELSPRLHDFGLLVVGEEAEFDLLIKSVGQAPLHISALGWASSGPLELRHFPPNTDSALFPGEELRVPLRFSPLNAGTEWASLTVWSNDPSSPTSMRVDADAIGPPELSLSFTGDAHWEAWIDGVDLGQHSDWWTVDTFTQALEPGRHVIAIMVRDTDFGVAGLIAQVEFDGQPVSLTGDGGWLVTADFPEVGWRELDFYSNHWTTPQACSNTEAWAESPGSLLDAGALWIWHHNACTAGISWFRLEFEI